MHPMAENLTNYHFNAYSPKQTTKDAKSFTANEIPRDDRSMNIRSISHCHKHARWLGNYLCCVRIMTIAEHHVVGF